MKPEFRIKENKSGRFEVYYVQKKESGFFLLSHKEVLKPYITYSGTQRVYPFSSLAVALSELKIEIDSHTEIDINTLNK